MFAQPNIGFTYRSNDCTATIMSASRCWISTTVNPKLSLIIGITLFLSARACGFIVTGPQMIPNGSTRVRKQTGGDVKNVDDASPRGLGRSATGRRVPSVKMNYEDDSSNFVEKLSKGWNTVIPLGEPNELPPCPSGVSSMSQPLQASILLAIFASLGAGTVAILNGLSALEVLLPQGWYSAWQITWAPALGLIFLAAGIAHFTEVEGFSNIYPGRGAWGIWYLPGNASFHVKWTGIAEIAGGLGLALSGLGLGPAGLETAAAWGLFVLTLAVTPANIYMFTHGAQFPIGLEVPVVGHFIRGILQCVLLANFWILAH